MSLSLHELGGSVTTEEDSEDTESFDEEMEIMLDIETKSWLAKICNNGRAVVPTCVYILTKDKTQAEFEEFLQYLLSLTKNLTRYYRTGFPPNFYSNCMLCVSWGETQLDRIPGRSYDSRFLWRRLITITSFNLKEKIMKYSECWVHDDDDDDDESDDEYANPFKALMIQRYMES